MKVNQSVIGRMLLGLLVFSFACAVPISGQGQDSGSFYKGKTITFLVSVGPGGGFDLYARMIAPFLEKETGATVVVQNMPGGEGYIALRHLQTAKPDGLSIIIFSGGKATLNQLFGDARAKGMDIKKFAWLSGVVKEPCILMLSKKLPYRSLNDLKAAKQTITSGTAGSLSNQHLAFAFLGEVAGIDTKIIPGFSGSAEQSLGAMRGELSAFMISEGSALEFSRQPELFPLLTVSMSRAKLFPNLPALPELVTLTPDQVKWIQRMENILTIERSILGTPGIPADRVQFLRGALKRVMTNKEFLAVAEKNQRLVGNIPGEEVEKIMLDILNMPANESKEFKRILNAHIMKSMSK